MEALTASEKHKKMWKVSSWINTFVKSTSDYNKYTAVAINKKSRPKSLYHAPPSLPPHPCETEISYVSLNNSQPPTETDQFITDNNNVIPILR